MNPLAAKVMQDIGIDISHHHSKILTDFAGQKFDFAITLCSDADQKCPGLIGGAETIHIGFDDPSQIEGEESEVLPEYCRVRDAIRERIKQFLLAKSHISPRHPTI